MSSIITLWEIRMTSYFSLALAILSMPMMASAQAPATQAPGQVIIVKPGTLPTTPTQVPFAAPVPVATYSMLAKVFGPTAQDAAIVFGPFVSAANSEKYEALLAKALSDPASGQEFREVTSELATQLKAATDTFSKVGAATPQEFAALLRETALDLAIVIVGPGLQGKPDLDQLVKSYSKSKAIVNFATVYRNARLNAGSRGWAVAYREAFKTVMKGLNVSEEQINRALSVVANGSCGVPANVTVN